MPPVTSAPGTLLDPPLSPQARAIAAQLAALPADELDRLSKQDGNPFARAVQSEIDRRIARANKERDNAGPLHPAAARSRS